MLAHHDLAVPASDALSARITALIMQGEFETGEKLSENALARRFGIGKARVRRALAQLAALGIVQIRPRIGTFVFSLDEAEFDHLNTARALLECAALTVAMAAPAAPRFVAALRVNYNEAHALGMRTHFRLAAADLRAYQALDRQFHRLAFEHANNPYLTRAYVAIDVKIWTLRSLLTFPEANVKNSLDAHGAVLDLLEAGATQAACQRLQDHIRKSFSAHARTVLGEGAR